MREAQIAQAAAAPPSSAQLAAEVRRVGAQSGMCGCADAAAARSPPFPRLLSALLSRPLRLSRRPQAYGKLQFDFPLVRPEALSALAEALPTAEEVKQVTTAYGAGGSLNAADAADADRFFLAMAQARSASLPQAPGPLHLPLSAPAAAAAPARQVPRAAAKVAGMRLRQEFESAAAAVASQAATWAAVCAEVQASEPLTRILEIILALGNILNRGSARGNAAGFKLSSLTKLVETKAANRSTTLLHYLAKTVEAKSADLLGFAASLSHLEPASKARTRRRGPFSDARQGG